MTTNFKFDTKKLEESFRKQATQAVNKKLIDVTCPHCRNKVKAHAGTSRCPRCGNLINITLNIKF